MTDKKQTEELSEQQLDQVTGGVLSNAPKEFGTWTTSGTTLKTDGDKLKPKGKGFASTAGGNPTV